MNPLTVLAELVAGLTEAAYEQTIRRLEASEDFASRLVASSTRMYECRCRAASFRFEMASSLLAAVNHISSLVAVDHVSPLLGSRWHRASSPP